MRRLTNKTAQAQELEEGVSDMEFESDDDEDGDEPPSKKAKA